MAEYNQNETSTQSAENTLNDVQTFTLQDLIGIVLHKWYWFLISIVLCIFVGVLYIMRTAPVYQRQATILVKDTRKGSGTNEMQAFSDLAGFTSRRNVDNELFVLQARRLMLMVIDQLGLTVNYTTKVGLRTVDLYGVSPIAVTFINDVDTQNCVFKVKLEEKGFTITSFRRGKATKQEAASDENFTAKGNYGDTIILPNGDIKIDSTPYLDEDYIGKTIRVSKTNREIVATRYRTATQSSVANKLSSIINISLNDVSARRAEDVINTLIAVYNQDAVDDKQQIAEATAEFIDERLSIISRELGTVDADVKAFKENNAVVDIKTNVEKTLTEATALKTEALSVDSQIEMAKFIQNYLNDPTKTYSLIPVTSIGDIQGSSALSTQIAKYNELLLKREKLLMNSSNNSPVIRELEGSKASLQKAILASLDSTIATLEIKVANIRREERKANSRISSVPKQEQQYLTIVRQQRIKEELYLYLLNKREENAISLAITENTARIIDSAFGPLHPVSPRKMFVMLIAIILGCAFPFAYFYLREILDTTVRSKHDIEKFTKVPYLGDVPIFTGETIRGVAVKESGRDTVSEAFRIIRTNMSFMNTQETKQQVLLVTSSNAHAGKTFVSTNLGMTLAFSGNKVLMIDLDLRRRTLTKHMGRRNNPMGVTKYISDSSVKVNQIITKSDLHENFDFVFAGLQPPNPAEMLLSKRLDDLITEARTMYDYIIIDSVPAMVIADALIISRVADLSVYVVREGLLDKRQLPDIDSLYRDNKLHNMCIILNGASERSHRYGYGYGYGYSYRYTYSYDNDGDEVHESRLAKLLNALHLSRFVYSGKSHHHHHHHHNG
ncbi:MAG: polysaccharide biosynthesis tyrosine autokinase [Alistipes sp.]|nr:polysaccharide biosynthesis tyrosine autokinase [Candidatus Alistipes equi]